MALIIKSLSIRVMLWLADLQASKLNGYGSCRSGGQFVCLITDAQKPVDADVVRVDANLEAESSLNSGSPTDDSLWCLLTT